MTGTLPPFARRTLGRFTLRTFPWDRAARVRPIEDRWLLPHPPDVRHVLVANAADYRKTPFLASESGRRRVGTGLLSSHGDRHRARRRALQPLFHRDALRRFGPLFLAEIDRAIDRWAGAGTIDLAAEAEALTRAAILGVLFGDDLAPDERARAARAIADRRRYTEIVYHGRLPLRDRLPTPAVRANGRAVATLEATIAAGIARRRAGKARGGLLSDLLEAAEPDGARLTDRDVRDEVLTFTSTGYETLGEALAWAGSLLARHPAEQEALHAETGEALGAAPPAAADLPRLGAVEACLDEALRLYPPTWIFVRVPVEPDRLPSGLDVRPGAILYVSPWVLHRHPDHFPDPERFDPARFAGRRPPRAAFLPFGDGPHTCLGENLARLEGVLALARILQRVRLDPIGPAPEPVGGITLRARGGIPLAVTLRPGA